MPKTLSSAAPLRTRAPHDSEVIAELSAGDIFEVLELAGGNAWGVARTPGLVGYIDAAALGEAA